MSNEKVMTSLRGFPVQLFPSALARLHHVWAVAGGMPMAELITATKNFPHLVPESVLGSGRVRTYDGYVWFWCPMFKLGVRSSLALVAFPWCQDFKKHHGTQSDRHMTVYARGPVPMDELNTLLKKMTGSLQAHIRKHPRKLSGTLAAYV